MPLNVSSFLVPSSGVPFVVEDKHVRGGFQILADTATRDAIPVAARKVGMRVLLLDTLLEYQLVGGIANSNWQLYKISQDQVDGLTDALSGKANLQHRHSMSEVEGLSDALTEKADINHVHEIAGVTGLSDALAAKADTSHKHSIADVNDLQSTLDSKADSSDVALALSGKSNTGHKHQMTDVNGLQSALDGKSDNSHVHSLVSQTVPGFMSAEDKAKLDNLSGNYVHPSGDGNLHVPATGTTNDKRVLKSGSTAGSAHWDQVDYTELTGVPATFPPSTHGHAIADVADLQSTLDGKSNTGHVHADATTSASGYMSVADKTKLNGIATNANNYVHPTTDGSHHVPATGTTNNKKVLKSGATAGSEAWGQVDYTELSGVPATFPSSPHGHAVSDVSGLQTALDSKLSGTGGTVSGNLTVTGDLVVQGSNTVINTQQMEISDPIITLARGNSTGVVPYAGIKIERGSSDAFMVWDEATDRFVAYTSADDMATTPTLSDMQARNFYGSLKGNADTANTAAKLASGRTITVSGDATGSVVFDGSTDINLAVEVADNSHAHTIGNVSGLQSALDGKSDSGHSHAAATTSTPGFMSAADKTKLDGVSSGATAYTHPSGDGNQHVPATGTTNNTKVLKAGATAGSANWGQVQYTELGSVPATFPPSTHGHVIADVADLPAAIANAGGDNLLYNPEFSIDGQLATATIARGWNLDSGSATGPTGTPSIVGSWLMPGERAMRIDFTGINTSDKYYSINNHFNYRMKAGAGLPITASIYARANNGMRLQIYIQALGADGVAIGAPASDLFDLVPEGGRYSFTYSQLPANTTMVSVFYRVRAAANGNNSGYIEGTRPKVEVGAKMTGWSSNNLFLSDLMQQGIANAGGENLLYNPGFEYWSNVNSTADGWFADVDSGATGVYSKMTSTYDGVGSSQKLEFSGLADAIGAYIYNADVRNKVLTGVRPVAGAMLVKATAGARIFLGVRAFNSAGSAVYYQEGLWTTATGDWQRLTVLATTTSDTVSTRLLLRVYGKSNLSSVVVEVDNAQLQIGTLITGWSDNNKVLGEQVAAQATLISNLNTAVAGKLGATAKAADSNLLDGYDSSMSATANTVAVRDANGKITASDFTMTSDARLKNIIGNIDEEQALQQVLQWQAVTYTLNGQTREMPGFVAQQIQQVSPDLVVDDGEYLSVSYALTSAYFAAAIRALMKRIDK